MTNLFSVLQFMYYIVLQYLLSAPVIGRSLPREIHNPVFEYNCAKVLCRSTISSNSIVGQETM